MQMMFEYLDDVHVVLCDNTGDYDNNKGGYQKWKKGDTWRKPTKYSAVWISPSDCHENKQDNHCFTPSVKKWLSYFDIDS